MGQNVKMTSPGYATKVQINFKNEVDYSATNFTFNYNIEATFQNAVSTATTNNLNIGSISTTNPAKVIFNSRNYPFVLLYRSLAVGVESLVTLTKLVQNKKGTQNFKLDQDDDVRISFSTSHPTFQINNVNLDYEYMAGTQIYFSGEYYYTPTTDHLTIGLESGVTYENLPILNFTEISKVTFTGRFWAPSETRPIGRISNCYYIEIPTGDFPYDILGTQEHIIVSGAATIHGKIETTLGSSSDMTISSIATFKHNVAIRGLVNAVIKVNSGSLNLDINEYYYTGFIYSNTIPITCAIDENGASHITVSSMGFLQPTRDITFLNIYGGISSVLTENQINALSYSRGQDILTIPDVVTIASTEIDFSPNCPSANEGIPGFTDSTNCFQLSFSKSGSNYVVKIEKYRSAYSQPYYICLQRGSSNCQNPPGWTGENPFKNFNVDSGAPPLSSMIPPGYTTIVFGLSRSNNLYSINFDDLNVQTYSNLDVTICAASTQNYQYYVRFTNTNAQKIRNLTLYKVSLADMSGSAVTYNLNMPIVHIGDCFFSSNCQYDFSANTVLTIDIAAATRLNAAGGACKKTAIFNYQSNDKKEFDVQIYSDRWSVCFSADCASVYYNRVDELTVNTYESGTITNQANEHDTIHGFTLNVERPLTITLRNDYWNLVSINRNIRISHGNHRVDIIYTFPEQGNKIDFSGNGPVIYDIKYENPQNLCFYEASPMGLSCQVMPDNVALGPIDAQSSDTIRTQTGPNYNVRIDGGNTEFVVNMLALDKKQLTFMETMFGTRSIKINFDQPAVDIHYSRTNFQNIILDTVQTSPTTAKFGQLDLINTQVTDNWKTNVGINVNKLTCFPSNLADFRSITVTDQMNITGPIQGVTATVTFVNDADANDLVATVTDTGDINIRIESGRVILGGITLIMTQSENYDALLVFVGKVNLDIECASGVQINQITRINIQLMAAESTVRFSGTWPTQPATDTVPLILIDTNNPINVTVTGYAPFSIINAIEIHIHAEGANCVIQGPLEYRFNYMYRERPQINIYSSMTSNVVLNIVNGFNIASMTSQGYNFTAIWSERVQLTIGKMVRVDQYQQSTFNFTVINTIGLSGSSSVTFTSPLPTNTYFSPTTLIRSTLTGNLNDERNLEFFRADRPVLRARYADLMNIIPRFQYLYATDDLNNMMHGFYMTMNCLNLIMRTEGTSAISWNLVRQRWPSEVPFVIEYIPEGQRSNAELVVTPSTQNIFNDLSNYVPSNIHDVFITLRTSMTPNFALNLDKIGSGSAEKVVTIIGATQVDMYSTLPSSDRLNISYFNVRVNIDGGNRELTANMLNLTDCSLVTTSYRVSTTGVKNLHVDVDSLNELVTKKMMSGFHNPMIIHSADIIIFTQDGWQFAENLAKPTVVVSPVDYDHVSFISTRYLNLRIDDPAVTTIKGLSLFANPQDDNTIYVTYTRYWGNLQRIDGDLVISTVDDINRIVIVSSSYPIPKIFNVPDEKIQIIFDTDDEGHFDTISFQDGYEINNENINLDFTELPESYQTARAIGMSVNGQSSFTFNQNVGTLEVNNLLIKPATNATLSNVLVHNRLEIQGSSSVNGVFDYAADSRLVIHWTLDGHGQVIYTGRVDQSPNVIELVYDDSSVDSFRYSQEMMNGNGLVLMRGDFNCLATRRKNTVFSGGYGPFTSGSNNVLDLDCDSSTDGQVLILYGTREISGDDAQGGGGGSSKLSAGGTAGVVIACAVVVAVIAAGVVFVIQKRRIDALKNELPIEDQRAYKTSYDETRSSSFDD